MSLMYLSDLFLAKLVNGIPANASRYTSPVPWVADTTTGSTWARETGVDVSFLPTLVVSADPRHDAENAIALHDALAVLSPAQATDERLWAYLTHVTYWEYMVVRWGTSKSSVIADRFFLRTRGIGSLVRNGIARLWWSAHLTKESGKSDKYELTRVLFSKQDIHTGLLQRSLGKSRMIRMAALEYFRDDFARLDAFGKWSTTVQRMMLDLNTAGGVYLLDALSPAEIKRLMKLSFEQLAA